MNYAGPSAQRVFQRRILPAIAGQNRMRTSLAPHLKLAGVCGPGWIVSVLPYCIVAHLTGQPQSPP